MTIHAIHAQYGFGDNLELWLGPDGVTYVGGSWDTGHFQTTANVPAEQVMVGAAKPDPDEPEYPTDALDFDTVEALGLDGTGQDGHPHFPYRWSDRWVQEYVARHVGAR